MEKRSQFSELKEEISSFTFIVFLNSFLCVGTALL